MPSPSPSPSMLSQPMALQPLRRASSDPVYSSTHLHDTPSSPSSTAAFFHHSSLQARSYSSPAIRPPPIESRVRSHRRQTYAPHRPSFEPLWEDTHSFSDAQLLEFQGRAVAINAKLARLKRVLGGEVFGRGDCGGAFRIFRQNIHLNHATPMCYVEDVFHARCGHWAPQPHVYHQCSRVSNSLSPQENNAIIGRSCYNKKTCGSREEDSVCQRCISADREKLQREGDPICNECGQRKTRGSSLSLRSLATETVAKIGENLLPTVPEESPMDAETEAGDDGFWRTEPADPRRQALLDTFLRGRRGSLEF